MKRHSPAITLLFFTTVALSGRLCAQVDDGAQIKVGLAEWIRANESPKQHYLNHSLGFDPTSLGRILNDADSVVKDSRQASSAKQVSDLARKVAFTLGVPVSTITDTFKCDDHGFNCAASDDILIQFGDPIVRGSHASIVYSVNELGGNLDQHVMHTYFFVVDFDRSPNGTWKGRRSRIVERGRPTLESKPAKGSTSGM